MSRVRRSGARLTRAYRAGGKSGMCFVSLGTSPAWRNRPILAELLAAADKAEQEKADQEKKGGEHAVPL